MDENGKCIMCKEFHPDFFECVPSENPFYENDLECK